MTQSISQTDIEIYNELFINREDIYFKQWSSNTGYGYVCVKPDNGDYRPLDSGLIQDHLEGRVTLGFPAVNSEGRSKWCCWDSDLDSNLLAEFQEYVLELGIIAYPEGKRLGREGHLWVFFDEPVASADLILVNEEFRAHLDEQFKHTEFFPKSIAGLSQVRGPLGVHRKPDARAMRGCFENAEGDLDSQLHFLHDIERTPKERIENLACALRTRTPRLRAMDHNASAPIAARPGDDFGAKISWAEILAPHGWQFVRQQGDEDFWRRPGKTDKGCSASTNFKNSNILKVFSCNAYPFDQDQTYTKFGAYALLNFDGDYSRCARELKRLGYGSIA